jgi:hypothetical protein
MGAHGCIGEREHATAHQKIKVTDGLRQRLDRNALDRICLRGLEGRPHRRSQIESVAELVERQPDVLTAMLHHRPELIGHMKQ